MINNLKVFQKQWLKIFISEQKLLNIIILEKAGIEKSTLINSILKLDNEKEHFGLIEKDFDEYISNERQA